MSTIYGKLGGASAVDTTDRDLLAQALEALEEIAETGMNQRKPLPPQSPCEMTQAEGKMFKLGWLECEAAHGIRGEA